MKTVHPVAIADHLWEVLERMAAEQGTDPEALVNQAIHLLGRVNGFIGPDPLAGLRAEVPADAERRAVAEKVLAAAERLESAIRERSTSSGDRPGPGPAGPPRTEGALVLVRDDGRPVPVEKDRFVIGRGRHCDLVIESGKVSREHAAISRGADGWILEDLGSANGTWHRRARVDRRRLEDGDEFFVCAERLRCRIG